MVVLLIVGVLLSRWQEGQAMPQCQKFESFDVAGQSNYQCTPSCLQVRSNAVRGTKYYSKRSEVCLSALHAGFVDKNGGLVAFKRDNEERQIVGTERNGIKSQSSYQYRKRYYFVKIEHSEKDSWPVDVFMIHNSYADKRLQISCIYDDPAPGFGLNFYKWNYVKFGQPGVTITARRLTYQSNLVENLRTFICQGKETRSDVRCALSIAYKDDCNVTEQSFVGIEGSELPISYKCNEGRTAYWKKIEAGQSIPNKIWNANDLILRDLQDSDDGFYKLGIRNENDHRLIVPSSAHFQVIVKKCPDGTYGPPTCNQNCHCHYGGVCEPITGRCICQPGFNGEKCQNICPLSYFGSACHLSCLKRDFGNFFNQRTNCRGLSFCLPKPSPCKCFHGFSGRACNNVIDLVKPLPYFKTEPIVTLLNQIATIQFNSWAPGVDEGHLYGMEIHSYEVEFKIEGGEWETIQHSQVEKVTRNSFRANLTIEESSKLYSTRVIVILNGLELTGRESFKENVTISVKDFATPCIDAIPTFALATSGDGWQLLIPAPPNNNGFQLHCDAYADYLDGSGEGELCDKGTSRSQKFFNCFVPISPGHVASLYIQCSNTFGKCNSGPYKAFREFHLQSFISKQDYEIVLEMFPILLHSDSSSLYIVEIIGSEAWQTIKRNTNTEETTEHFLNSYGKDEIGIIFKMGRDELKKYKEGVSFSVESSVQNGVSDFGIILHFTFNGNDHVKTLEVKFNPCPTFSKLTSAKNFKCRSNCLSIETSFSKDVYGTHIYGKSSSVCLAAVHAGVIDFKTGGSTAYFERKILSSKTSSEGTISNRIISKSSSLENEAFIFNQAKYVPKLYNSDTWLPDVYLLHNSYFGGLLKIGCLRDGNISKYGLFNWKGTAIVAKTIGKLITKSPPKTANTRVIRCRGEHPLTDVTGVFQKSSDVPVIPATFTGVMERPYNLPSKLSHYGFHRKLPNDWKYIFRRNGDNLRVNFDVLKSSDEGIYIYKNYSRNTKWIQSVKSNVEENGAYFQLIVRECPQNKFGPSCGKTCQDCRFGGHCHPLTGSCICRPGFGGKRCDEICDLDHFGSKCHLNCESKSFGGFFGSVNSCRGLMFCLPRPYGCSCMHGYKGRQCREYDDLVKPFPHFGNDNPPKIKLMSGNDAKITFNSWNMSKDPGFLYGLKISSYDVRYRNESTLSWSKIKTVVAEPWKKVHEVRFSNPAPGVLFEISVKININNNARERSGGRAPNDDQARAIAKFSSPCEVMGIGSKLIKRHSTALASRIPVPKEKFTFPITCSFTVAKLDNGDMATSSNGCHDIVVAEGSPYFECQVTNLPSGEIFKTVTDCGNKFGQCRKITLNVSTIPDLEQLVTLQEKMIIISNFSILNKDTTHLSYYTTESKDYTKKIKLLTDIVKGSGKQQVRTTSLGFIGPYDLMTSAKIKSEGLSYNLTDFKINKEQDVAVVLMLQYDVGSGREYVVSSYALDSIVVPPPSLGYIAIILLLLPVLAVIAIWYLRKKNGTNKPNSSIGGTLMSMQRVQAPAEDEFNTNRNVNLNKNSSLPRPSTLLMNNPRLNSKPMHGNSTHDVSAIQWEDNKALIFQTTENTEEDIYEDVRPPDVDGLVEKYLVKSIDSLSVAEEFKTIPTYDASRSLEYGQIPQNKRKNRYINNLPYDETRVVLSKNADDPFSDYINANFVQNPHNKKKWYIASQGPKDENDNTISDFWKMILENGVEVVIMVADFVENGKKKVGRYFDRDRPLFFEDYSVTVEVTDVVYDPSYILSTIKIKQFQREKVILHYQYIIWPDHGIPTEANSITSMIRSVIQNFKRGGIVVHCSAGIGRTGTILLVLLTKEMYDNTGRFDPLNIVRQLRKSRGRLVENTGQYNFGLKVLYELFFEEKGLLSTSDFDDPVEGIIRRHQDLYNDLCSLYFDNTFEAGKKHPKLNRNMSFMPPDLKRVFLEPPEEIEAYINAIEMKLIHFDDLLVSTEYPLPNTMESFLWMLIERNASAIVLINEVETKLDYPPLYSTTDMVLEYGEFTLERQNTQELSANIIKYDLLIKYQNLKQKVAILQMKSWMPGEDRPPNVAVVAEAISILFNSKESLPLLCCSDGVTGCGLVATSAVLIADFLHKNKFNIYRSALQLKQQRPHFIVSQAQFVFLYKVANYYIKNYAL